MFDCFERIRDTAAAMREALSAGDWTEVGRQIAVEWENRKRLAPGVTTPVIDDADRARDGAPARVAAKVCGAGGGGCLFCFAEPARSRPSAARWPPEARAVLDFRIETEGLRVG